MWRSRRIKAYSEHLRKKVVNAGKSPITLMLLAILFVALALRLYQLNAESLWIDEATSVSIGQNSLGQVLSSSFDDGNPPLYYLLLHLWMQLFGDSELSVRLPSVFFGAFSVAMLYKIGTLLFNKWTGLISAFILAISAYQIYFSQEARTYSMMVLLTLISFYFFWKLFEGRDYRVLVGYVLSTTALLYSHYYGLFFIIAQALFVLGYYSSKRHRDEGLLFRTWVLVGGSVAALYIPGFFYLAYAIAHPEPRLWIEKPTLGTLYNSFLHYTGAAGRPSPELLSLLLLFVLISIALLARSKGERVKLYLLSLWLVIPTFLPFLLSQVIAPMYVARYSIAALPALYLLAAEGMRRVSTIQRRDSINQHMPLTTLVVLGFYVSVMSFLCLNVLYDYYTTVKKERWREVVSYIQRRAEPGDLLVFSTKARNGFYAYDYYARGEDLPQEVRLRPEQAEEASVAASNSDRVWLMFSRLSNDKENQFKTELEKAGLEEIYYKHYEAVNGSVDLMLFNKQ